MQQIYTERQQQQANVRQPRQLPANIIKETNSPTQPKFVNKTSKSAPIRSEQITHTNQQPSPLRRWQTDLDDLNTHRSLSPCPTYSSLSTHSPDTRECATQIITFTPPDTFEDDREISHDSPLPIDINNQILLIEEPPLEEVELMPVASGFGNYPYNYPTTRTTRVPKFQEKNQNGLNASTNGRQPPPRPTAVKQQSPRSDTFSVPIKRNESKSKDPKRNSTENVPSQQSSTKKPTAKKSSTPPDKKRIEPVQRNATNRPVQKYIHSPVEQENPLRKPVRLVNRHNNAYPPPPDNKKKFASSSHNVSARPQRRHIADNEYAIRRPQRVPPEYAYDDRRSHSPIERASARRFVRVIRDPSYHEEEEDENDVYYIEPARTRRPRVIRRAPSREYVYVDEMPSPVRHRRRSRRAEIVYIDDDDDDDVEDDRPLEDEDEYVYVDQHGNEVDMGKDRHHSSRPIQYVYDDDEKHKRHSQKSKIIYVDDDAPVIAQQGHKKKSKQPSSTKIVYK